MVVVEAAAAVASERDLGERTRRDRVRAMTSGGRRAHSARRDMLSESVARLEPERERATGQLVAGRPAMSETTLSSSHTPACELRPSQRWLRVHCSAPDRPTRAPAALLD